MAPPKYRVIFEELRQEIYSGKYKPGERLPSEHTLEERFEASRMTVYKAVRELQSLGIVHRKVGSGTYITGSSKTDSYTFGLLIAELGQTEIFELICRGMTGSPLSATHSLSWGHADRSDNSPGSAVRQLCRQFIDQGVSGVFFGPEYDPRACEANRTILRSLDEAGIPVVLVDRCSLPYPEHPEYDLVGLDNHRAGYIVTDHLIQQGGTQVAFFTSQHSSETVEERIGGYLEALCKHDLKIARERVFRGDPGNKAFVEQALRKHRIDSIMCANDYIAATLMHTLIGLGVSIPDDIKIAGVDDFRYASLTPVPLTTFRQPCEEIGAVCMLTMLERIKNRNLPPRSIQLNGKLVVRKSTDSSAATRENDKSPSAPKPGDGRAR